MPDSTFGTKKHIQAVIEIGIVLVDKLILRLHNHDRSKLFSPEREILDEHAAAPDGYATGLLKPRSDRLKEFMQHHYAVNRHHPEHFDNGIDDMNLIDILEMFVDWLASSMRTKDGNIYTFIQFNAQRFKISPQLKRILMNTALLLDEKVIELRDEYSEEPVAVHPD